MTKLYNLPTTDSSFVNYRRLDFSKLPPNPLEQTKIRLKQWLYRLRVGQKIGWGYASALSIAVVGTVTGLALGAYYQNYAWKQQHDARQKLELIHQLQTRLLTTQNRQQQLLVEPLAKFQGNYNQLLASETPLKQQWGALQTLLSRNANSQLLNKYQTVSDTYFQQLENEVELANFNAPAAPGEIAAAKKRLLNFSQSPSALRFAQLSEELNYLVRAAQRDQILAQQNFKTADSLRFALIALSLVLSVAIACLLSIYTSRAISNPLKALTQVAQKATQDSNFDLQAPLIMDDEVGVLADSLNQLIQRVKHLLEEQKNATAQQLIQNEKMSSLGQMVAGVVQEINTPVNYIYGNLLYANQYLNDLLSIIHAYSAEIPDTPPVVQEKLKEIEIDFLEEDLPKLMQSLKLGAARIRHMVSSLRNFSCLDDTEVQSIDIHTCLDSNLLILSNRLKQGITIEKNYGDIPIIEGYAGSLYQVFMNLLSNAIDAIEEGNEEHKLITIVTEVLERDRAVIRIADQGCGIHPEHQHKIFEPFFTTKSVRGGTGMGLSICRQIIEEKHGGTLTFESEVGVGAEFTVVLPIKHKAELALASSPFLAAVLAWEKQISAAESRGDMKSG
ncbi:ATP-binding protein [Lusitaniella coriacea]|uniref:sensor histidine kinase n=1 Tax=Lusitaniella coriacea TaxID=1983105 RepID=UPI003CF1ADE2